MSDASPMVLKMCRLRLRESSDDREKAPPMPLFSSTITGVVAK